MLRSIGAVLAALIFTNVCGVVLFRLHLAFFEPKDLVLPTRFIGIDLFYRFYVACVGGYLVGLIATRAEVKHAGVVCLMQLVLGGGLLYFSHVRGLFRAEPWWYQLAEVGVILPGYLIGAAFRAYRKKSATGAASSPEPLQPGRGGTTTRQ